MNDDKSDEKFIEKKLIELGPMVTLKQIMTAIKTHPEGVSISENKIRTMFIKKYYK